ncbi:MAG: threonine/serine exporter family protein [Pseudomonadota bacterium]
MDTERVLRIALLAGETLMQSGAEIYRAEDTARIICKSYDVEAECVFMPTGIFISGYGEDNRSVSQLKRITTRTVDLHRIEMINTFSRKINEEQISIEEAEKELLRIKECPYFKFSTMLAAASLTAPVYTLLFNGTVQDALLAAMISTILYIVNSGISSIGFFPFFSVFISGMLAGALTIFANILYPMIHMDKVIIGAIMILVPGIAITNAIKDALKGDLLSSLTRIGEALLVVTAVGAGVGLMMTIKLH